jgi:ADP-ribose pyrophosphatase
MRILHTGEFLRLIREEHWEYVQRVKASGAAIIIAVTPEQKVLLVEQHRIPLNARTIEMPAGIIGDEAEHSAESHEEAARRELLEETGYEARHVEAVARGASSAGVTSEVVTMFLASDLRKVHHGGGVAHERITVHEVPLEEVDGWLKKKAAEGILVDPKLYAGLYLMGCRKPT